MAEAILSVLGGVGLFLFGMKVLTDALRDAAGSGLSAALTRLTTTPLRGALTGLGITALIQSSSATTVITVGLVGAGLLGMPQSLGVLYGANIGTTVTGWIVAFVGLKLQVGVLAQPVLFGAALVLLLTRGRAVRIARGVAGLCLLFLGLDLMQGAASLAEGWLVPGMLPGDTLAGRLVLVLMGFALVLVVQSSSAGMAIVLVLLAGDALTFAQAAALVIGLNLGSPMTAVLAAIGGGRAMRQTALANVLFNLGTALLAFPLLGLAGPALNRIAGGDPLAALVLFHTAFNLLGAAVFLAINRPFAALVERLVPHDTAGLSSGLDRTLLSDPETALGAAEHCADLIERTLFDALGAALARPPDLRPLSALSRRVPPAQEALERYLAQLRLPEGRQSLHDRYAALLHRMDHLQRLDRRIDRLTPFATIAADARLRRAGVLLGGRLISPTTTAADLERLSRLLDSRAMVFRRRTLGRGSAVSTAQDLFDRTDAVRWLARLADHAEAIARHRPPR